MKASNWFRQQQHWVRSPQGLFVLTVLTPLLIYYIGWLLVPLGYSAAMSLFEWRPLIKVPQPFLGTKNYHEALTDPIFLTTMRNTLYFAVVSVPLGTCVSLLLALALNSMKRFAAFYRTVFFIPVITSMVACAIMWKWIYQPQFGFLSAFARQANDSLGTRLPTTVGWLTDKRLAMDSIILMSIWRDAGFAMVVYLAGLQGIPASLRDAARVDGANTWQLLRHIVLPLLQPTTLFVVVTGVIGALQVFAQVYVMTRGGPGNATRVVVLYLYEKAFSSFRFGYASALAFILFVVTLTLTLLQLRTLTSRWQY